MYKQNINKDKMNSGILFPNSLHNFQKYTDNKKRSKKIQLKTDTHYVEDSVGV
jgi:hypothetical protein